MLFPIIIEVNNILNSLLGSLLNDLERIEEAIRDFSMAIDLNPHFADFHKNRGLKLFRN